MPRTLIIDTETRGLRPELGETAFAAATSWLEDEQKRVTLFRFDQSEDSAGLLADVAQADAILGHNLVFDLRQLVRTLKLDEGHFDGKQLMDTRTRATYAWPARYFTAKIRGEKPFALKSLTAGAQGVPGDEKALKKWLVDRAVALYGKNRRKWEPWMKAQLHDYSLVPDDMLAPYLIGDIVRTRLLFERCEFHLATATPGTWRSLEVDELLLHPILRMQLRGLPCSLVELETQVEAMKNQLKGLRQDIGWDYRVNANMVERWGDLAARFGFYTKKPSKKTGLRKLRFDVHALKRFAREGAPEAEKVLKARHYQTRLSNYGKVWDPWARRLGKLHCYLNVEGTHTGRFSCNGPNLQTMPKGKDGLRRCITPEPGMAMICADWSAMEFVGGAHVARDPVLLEDCLTGDVHLRTAEMLFGTLAQPGTDRLKMQRGCGKTFNLAQLYGAQEQKLRQGLEKETGEAWPVARLVKSLDYLRSRYANLNQWRMTTQASAEKGIAQTDPWGRRYLPQRRREFAVINAIVQGFCAGVMKRAVLRAHEHGLDLRMVVHDELIFMVPADDVARKVKIVGDMMRVIEGYSFPVEVLVATENYAIKRPLEKLEVKA